ncbi:hypothetical protein FB459_1271 [Yimella lutea]|uniref:AAA domain-containing protein n=1 Tax=Yimella lutea TaxID=587872 RepID=A0A542EEZ7_9MICO|nr:AAA family ATPase [Yimella lutea]TQJ13836.1 hypothetical protein FB459_1271 [Yimella lutea]
MSLHSVDADRYDEDGVLTRRTWQPVDLAEVLAGKWQAPTATIGRRSDGRGLFYPGKAHTIASESEGGKTWLALIAAADEMAAGHHVGYIDFEDAEGPVVWRLLTLGVPPEVIAERFHYFRPEEAITDALARIDLAGFMSSRAPTLVILDGITEGMTLHGLDPLNNKDAAMFGRLLVRPLTSYGAAVVSLDHVTKSAEGRGRYAIGAVHKLNALDGAAYVLENRSKFGRGLVGRSSVLIAKDRPGDLRKDARPASGGLHWFADLVIDASDPDESCIVGEVRAPEDGAREAHRPTMMMQRVADTLTEHPQGLAQRVLCDVVTGKTETIRTALSHLIADGYVSPTPHRLVKPYPGENGGQE